MKRVFITGASGFLGHHLLSQLPPDVAVLAQRRNAPLFIQNDRITPVSINFFLPQWEAVRAFRPEVIIHTAARGRADECQRDPALARMVNTVTTQHLADLAAQLDARFIYTSTDLVFDGQRGRYREEDVAAPLNVYAQTKAAAERYVAGRLENAVIARCALIYGMALHGKPTFTQAMLRSLGEGKAATLFTDEFRSPVLVSDLAAAIWELAANSFRGTIHLGGATRHSRYEMGEIICREFGLPASLLIAKKSADINFAAPRPSDCSLDTALAARVLDTPLRGFADGVGQMLPPAIDR